MPGEYALNVLPGQALRDQPNEYLTYFQPSGKSIHSGSFETECAHVQENQE